VSRLDDPKIHASVDTKQMYEKIIHFPEQILQAYFEVKLHEPKDPTLPKRSDIDQLIICGMGGSAISGDIAQTCFSKDLPITVVKDYKIPYLTEKSLVVVISYSGNTEESISCFEQAAEVTPHLGAVTSGGRIKELLQESNLWVELKAGMPPRSAVGHLFFSLIKILEFYKIIPVQEAVVKKIVASVIKKAGAICLAVEEDKNFAKNSAVKIQGKIPVIYPAAPALFPLAYRWKCQFNENAKYPAFCHTFPEMNHNEIEGWENDVLNTQFLPIFLKRVDEPENYDKRIRAFKQILQKNKIDYLEFFLDGESLMEGIFSLIYLGDMISYYLAVLDNTDPTEIKYIDLLKKEINKEG